jgi:hypothetical protein
MLLDYDFMALAAVKQIANVIAKRCSVFASAHLSGC